MASAECCLSQDCSCPEMTALLGLYNSYEYNSLFTIGTNGQPYNITTDFAQELANVTLCFFVSLHKSNCAICKEYRDYMDIDSPAKVGMSISPESQSQAEPDHKQTPEQCCAVAETDTQTTPQQQTTIANTPEQPKRSQKRKHSAIEQEVSIVGAEVEDDDEDARTEKETAVQKRARLFPELIKELIRCNTLITESKHDFQYYLEERYEFINTMNTINNNLTENNVRNAVLFCYRVASGKVKFDLLGAYLVGFAIDKFIDKNCCNLVAAYAKLFPTTENEVKFDYVCKCHKFFQWLNLFKDAPCIVFFCDWKWNNLVSCFPKEKKGTVSMFVSALEAAGFERLSSSSS